MAESEQQPDDAMKAREQFAKLLGKLLAEEWSRQQNQKQQQLTKRIWWLHMSEMAILREMVDVQRKEGVDVTKCDEHSAEVDRLELELCGIYGFKVEDFDPENEPELPPSQGK